MVLGGGGSYGRGTPAGVEGDSADGGGGGVVGGLPRKVDARPPEKWNSNSHDARLVHLTITVNSAFGPVSCQ